MKTPISKNYYRGRKIKDPRRLLELKSVYNSLIKRIEPVAWLRSQHFWRILSNVKQGIYFEIKK